MSLTIFRLPTIVRSKSFWPSPGLVAWVSSSSGSIPGLVCLRLEMQVRSDTGYSLPLTFRDSWKTAQFSKRAGVTATSQTSPPSVTAPSLRLSLIDRRTVAFLSLHPSTIPHTRHSVRATTLRAEGPCRLLAHVMFVGVSQTTASVFQIAVKRNWIA